MAACLSPSYWNGEPRRCWKCQTCMSLRGWLKSLRLSLETHGHKERTWFCTLTLRDPVPPDAYSLVQRWLKRARKNIASIDGSARLRFFCAEEHGSRHGRLHFHLLLWCSHAVKYRTIPVWEYGFYQYKLADAVKHPRYIAKYLSKGAKIRASIRLGLPVFLEVHKHPIVQETMRQFPGSQVSAIGGTKVPREFHSYAPPVPPLIADDTTEYPWSSDEADMMGLPRMTASTPEAEPRLSRSPDKPTYRRRW